MIGIKITEEVATNEDMVYLLEDIARKIRSGYTSGHGWELQTLEDEKAINEVDLPDDEVEESKTQNEY